MSSLDIPIRDNDGTLGKASFPVGDSSSTVDLTALYGAVNDLTIGTMGTSVFVQNTINDVGTDVNSPDEQARKNRAFRVTYQGTINTRLKGSVTIACADALLVPGVEQLDIASGVGLALKNAFETVGAHRATGETITVTSIVFLN